MAKFEVKCYPAACTGGQISLYITIQKTGTCGRITVLVVLAKEQFQTMAVELQQTPLCVRSKKKSPQNQPEEEGAVAEGGDGVGVAAVSSLLRKHSKTDMRKLTRKKERLLGNFLEEPPLQMFHDILELLMSQTLKTSHGGQFILASLRGSSLLRYGIAVRHSENTNCIRLEAID
uniref:Uncharacterized protein n=1 Tax=Callorhinchus milii TaxID=7868 RepID=A0A4W3K842_CALMI